MNRFSNLKWCLLMATLISTLHISVLQGQATHLVISQVYGGGGNSGSTYKNDYVELFNPSPAAINLAGHSIQYASGTGSTWAVLLLPTFNLQPGQYFLIQLAQGSGGTTLLPTPDVTGTIAMSATVGKVALLSSTTALSGTCPLASSVDFVGFGSTANCFEGGGPTPAPSNTNAVIRANNGCTDTDNNNLDFVAGLPVPRNSSSTFNPCSAPCVAPTFSSCPATVNLNTDAGLCTATAIYSVMATGSPSPTLTYAFNGASTGSGSGDGTGGSLSAGTTIVTVTATNACGTATCSFNVIVTDNQPPTAICQNATVNLDFTGNATITPALVNNGSTDNCGIASLAVSPTTLNCSNLSAGGSASGLFFSEYVEGSSNNKYLEIYNGTGATVDLANYQIRLYANGAASPTTTNTLSGLLANGATIVYRNSSAVVYGGTSTVLSAVNFNGDDAIALYNTVSGLNEDIFGVIGNDPGSSWSLGGNTTVDKTLRRKSTVTGGVTTNPSGTGAGAFTTLATEWDQFNQDDVTGLGAHTFAPPPSTTPVTLTVTDVNGNISSCIAQVTVVDNIPPTIATCASNQDVNLDGACQLTVPNLVVQTTSTDNCSFNISQSPAAGTVLASSHNQTHMVIITVTDASGLTATCTVTLTAKDVTPPTAICQNVTVNLDNTGNASITPAMVNNGSTDNCGTVNLVSVTPNTFNCSNVSVPAAASVWINEIHYDNSGTDAGEFIELAGTAGMNLADYALIRYNGSTPSAAVIYTTAAQITPLTGTIPSQSNGYGTFAVYYDVNGLQNGTNDGVALVNVTTGSVVQLLSYEGVFTVASGQGLASGMTSTDIGVSEAGLLTGGSVALTGLGNQYSQFTWQAEAAPATPGAINTGQSFPSATNLVTLLVNDGNGNTSTCTAVVTVQDNVAPVAVCQAVTVQLDAMGNGSVTAAQVNNGSSDACGIASMSVTPNTFTCANVGSNTVTLTVTDNNGNVSSCTTVVTVEDNVAPVALCQNVTVQLDVMGNGSVTAAQVNNGSSDACGIASMTVSPNTFTCANVGPNTVTLTVTDNNGNVSSCTTVVTVEDNVAPVALCQNVTVQLDAMGNGSVTAAQVNNGSSDACGIASLSVSPNTFTCANVGPNTVTLTVTDVNGNVSSCTATVTVEDNVAPVAVCQNVTVQLDATGNGSVTAAQVNNGSSDACGIASMSVTPNTFTCANVGSNTVTLTVTDNNGNVSTCTAIVTVQDNVAPVALCQAVTVQLDAMGNGSVTAAQVNNGSSDACGIASVSVSPNTFTCANVGPNTVTLTVTDVNGNVSSCNATVTVVDAINPTISCQQSISTINNPGICGAVVNFTMPVASDNCSGYAINQTAGLSSGSTFPVGTTTNTFVVTDASGNTATCSFDVIVTDVENPSFINVPASFSACNPISWTEPTPVDNCPGVNMTSNYPPGTTFPPGTTTIWYKATDAYNHQDSVSFDVTVLPPSEEADSISSNRAYNNICNGENVTLTLHGGILGDNAQWKWYRSSCGGSLVASGVTSITVNPTTTTTYYARAEGTCNNTACVSLTVVVSSGPPTITPTYTVVPAYGAPGITDVISVAPVPGATYYQWFTNNGQINGCLFNGQLSPVQTVPPTVDVTFVLSQQNYQIRVFAGNACGRTGQRNTTIRGTVSATTCINGPTAICPGTAYAYSACPIPSQSGNTSVSYQWSLAPASAGTISGSGTNVTVTYNTGFTTAQLCVAGVSSFGLVGQAYCITVNTNAPAPAAISGPVAPCEGASVSYSIAPVSGAVSYNWSTNIAGATISGSGTSVTVNYPNSSFTGNICAAAVSATCGTSLPTCLAVASDAPGTIAFINAPVLGVCNSSNVNYTVSTGANNYVWSLPAGVTYTGAANLNSINLNFGPSFTSGIVSVTAYYDCGTANTSLFVSGVPPAPTITPADICANQGNVLYTASATSATSYNWALSNVNGIHYCDNPPTCSQYFVNDFYAGGSMSVTATNSCGTGAATNLYENCRVMGNGNLGTTIYPNPTHGKVTIEFNIRQKGYTIIKVTDISGREIFYTGISANEGLNRMQLELGSYGAGMYLVYVTDDEGNASVNRIAVE